MKILNFGGEDHYGKYGHVKSIIVKTFYGLTRFRSPTQGIENGSFESHYALRVICF